jgi:hypothetical protein
MQTPSQIPKLFLSLNGSERNPECFSLLRNGSERNSKHFIFRGMVRNEIVKFRVFFSERNSELFFSSEKWFGTEFLVFYLPRNGSERNSKHFPLRGADGIPPE